MKAKGAAPATVDEYIATFPKSVQVILNRVRRTVRKAAPAAEEKISYRMPAYMQDGVLLYFGGFAEHVGVYPPIRDKAIMRDAAPYANERGNFRFRYDEAIPWELIARIVRARLEENALKAAAKAKKARAR